MKFTFSLAIFIFALFYSEIMHAEGGCPPGMLPASGTDITSCAPIYPGYYGNNQQSMPMPPKFIPQWGAIATDPVKGILSAQNNASSQYEAKDLAMRDCNRKGGVSCQIDVVYGNQCAALAVGHTGYNSAADASLAVAEKSALNACNAAGDQCIVYYSACNLPIRIQ